MLNTFIQTLFNFYFQVTFMNDNLSKVYAKSAKSEQDHREYPEVLREALSIGKAYFKFKISPLDGQTYFLTYWSLCVLNYIFTF